MNIGCARRCLTPQAEEVYLIAFGQSFLCLGYCICFTLRIGISYA